MALALDWKVQALALGGSDLGLNILA